MQHKQEPPSLIAIFFYYVIGSMVLGLLLNYIFYGKEHWYFFAAWGVVFALCMTGMEWYRRNSQWKQ